MRTDLRIFRVACREGFVAADPDTVRAVIAVNRFGLGARKGEDLPADPVGWLSSQVTPSGTGAVAGTSRSKALVRKITAMESELKKTDKERRIRLRRRYRRTMAEVYAGDVEARIDGALTSDTPFLERLVHFWSNHFAISADRPKLIALAGSFEAEAIRQNVLGNFRDMLLAVVRHPAMLIYLDQLNSTGPRSSLARRRPARGFNENLAREILELHTLGVRTGYTQADVTALALALTGWSMQLRGGDDAGGFAFKRVLHEPGPKTILGRRYEADGVGQAEAVLIDVAVAEPTARHIATKLARHFAGDVPPPALVDRIAAAFLTGDGDLPTVYRALIELPEPWVPAPIKFKTPWEWTISALRAVGAADVKPGWGDQALTALGQTVWKPGSPAGFADDADSWVAPEALLRRVDLAPRIADRAGPGTDPRVLMDAILGATASEETVREVSFAELALTGLSLLLVSPEFLRR